MYNYNLLRLSLNVKKTNEILARQDKILRYIQAEQERQGRIVEYLIRERNDINW